MADHKNASDYAAANIAVAAGTASEHQISLVNTAAKQAGGPGNAARAAQQAAGKK